MSDSAWAEQAHSVMNGFGALSVAQTFLILTIYFYLHRKGAATQVLRWSTLKVNAVCSARCLPDVASWVVATCILILPFATINFVARMAMREVRYYYDGIEPTRLSWIADNALSMLTTLIIVIGFVGIYAALDTLLYWELTKNKFQKEKPPRNNRLTQFVSHLEQRARRAWAWWSGTSVGVAVNGVCDFVIHQRRQAASTMFHRLVCHGLIVCGLLIAVQVSLDYADGRRDKTWSESVPASPRKQAILEMARDAGIEQVDLRIQHKADSSRELNAWGTHRDRGARIEFSESLYAELNDAEILIIVGHELYHVKYENIYLLLAEFSLMVLFSISFVIGIPTRVPKPRTALNPIIRMPIYILIFTAMWPIFQIAINSIQRQQEAEADVYGAQLAVARGIPLEKAKLTLIMLSEKSRHDPEPFWLFKYLFYDHPPLGERLSNIAKVETRSPEGVRRQ